MVKYERYAVQVFHPLNLGFAPNSASSFLPILAFPLMISDNQIEVGVRVGLFGDREYSELVQEKITSRFKKHYPSD